MKRRYRIDLPAHLALCDANYLRLMQLVPDLDVQAKRALSLAMAEQNVCVRFRLLEQCPYTSLIELTQTARLDSLHFDLPLPRLIIRLYHDARSAEVVEYQNGRRFDAVYPYPNPEMRHRDEKVQINRFLGEYLAICLVHGAAIPESVTTADG